jgi:tripartite-type tricarboxylate transporter receptor subunit TctC
MLKRITNVNMTFLPYPGVAPAINALLGEHVTSVFATYSTASEQLKAGKMRALATPHRHGSSFCPMCRRSPRAGYKDYEMSWTIGWEC